MSVRDDLVQAGRVLVDHGILDAFGHVSAREPDDSSRFLLSRNQAPALVTATDLQSYDFDGNTDDPRPGYLERFLHAAIYRARPDVGAIVHTHAASLIPFGVTTAPFGAVWHMAAFLGEHVPVFEIRDHVGDASDLLIRDGARGGALAADLGEASAVLMRGHGATVVGRDVREAVFRAVYAEANARALAGALALGPVTRLTAAEARAADAANAGQIGRAWEVWTR